MSLRLTGYQTSAIRKRLPVHLESLKVAEAVGLGCEGFAS